MAKSKATQGPQQGPPPAVFSYGGGVQSMAALVLAAEGRIPLRHFVFSNLGEDTEYPETTAHLHEVAIPYAKRHGIHLHVLTKVDRDGKPMTLLSYMLQEGRRSFPIPVRLTDPGVEGMPGKRACTQDWKSLVVARWMRDHGATKANPGLVGIGISVDEMMRCKPSHLEYLRLYWPLIEENLDRQDCVQLIKRAGLAVPPKSSCIFCPFHSDLTWQRLLDKNPDAFAASAALEEHINAIKRENGQNPAYLSKHLRPLAEVFDGSHREQLAMFSEDDAEEGRYSCGPFACNETGEPDPDPSDPTAGLIVRRVA